MQKDLIESEIISEKGCDLSVAETDGGIYVLIDSGTELFYPTQYDCENIHHQESI